MSDTSERFPYVPDADKGRRGMTRDAARSAAIAVAAEEKAHFHFYGKPKAQVVDDHTLRDWIVAWKNEVCEKPERKSGVGDGRQVMQLIKVADEFASANKRNSIMNRKVVDLRRHDFSGPHGLLNMLTGRAPKRKKGEDAAPKPPASPATQRRALALLGCVWNHAHEEWGITKLPRPWLGITIKTKEKKPTTRALSIQEYEAVEKALELVDKKVLAAIHFLRWTAARSGEMQKLRWEHITWATPSNGLTLPLVRFEGTKTPKQGAYREREIHLVPGAQAALAMLYNEAPPKKGIVFQSPSDSSKALSRHTAYQAFTRAVRRAGVPHTRLHDLRHTRTTELSMSLHKAQAMLVTGHSDERTFMRYTHLADDAGTAIVAADARRAKLAKIVPGVSKGTTARDVAESLKDLSHEEKMKLIATLASS